MTEADHTHISEEEAMAATEQPFDDLPEEKSWLPTKKWWALLSTGLVTIFFHWMATGEFDGTERGQLTVLAVTLVSTYWTRNDPTPGGVPYK